MPYSKKWNEIIPEPKKIFEITLKDLLYNYLNFENKKLIYIDLETLGFHPRFEYEQIIEIAAEFVDGSSNIIYEKFHNKILLSKSACDLINVTDSVQRYNWELRQKKKRKSAITSPEQILRFTKYDESNISKVTEEVALYKLFRIIEETENPILIAHNTEFDINYLQTRGKRYGLVLPPSDVLDTLKLSRYFFIPLLKTLQKNNNKSENHVIGELTRFQNNRIHFSSRLGDLANALGINSKKWHSADADVIMMREVLNKMILFFKKILI